MNVLRSFADICSTSTTLVYIFLQILRGQSQLLNVSSLPRHPTIQDFKNAQNFFRISWGARPSGPSCPLWTRLGGSEALRLRHVSETWWRSSPHALGYLANFISSGTVGTRKSRRLQVPNKSNKLWQDPFLFQKGNICDMFDKLIRFTTGAALDPTVQSHWMIEAQTRPESIATLVNPSHYSECFEDKRLCTVIKLSEK